MLTKHQNQKEIQPYHAQSLQLMGLSLQLNASYLTRFCRQRQKRAFQALRPLCTKSMTCKFTFQLHKKNLVKISLDSAITGINPHYFLNFWPKLKKKRATNRRHTFLIRIVLAQTNFFVTLSTTNPKNPTFAKYFTISPPQPNSYTYSPRAKLFAKSDHSKQIFRKQMEVLSVEFCCNISILDVW